MNLDSLSPFILSLVTFIPAGGGLLILLIPRRDRDIKLFAFVISMLDDPGAMTLVSTIISLAHSLKLQVVAEGVESEEQAKFLRLLRCDQMQGYLISKPLSFEDMTAYLARSRG